MGQKEVRARQIVLGGEEEAKQIIAQLKKGQSLKMSPAPNQRPAAKQTGGDMDWGAIWA